MHAVLAASVHTGGLQKAHALSGKAAPKQTLSCLLTRWGLQKRYAKRGPFVGRTRTPLTSAAAHGYHTHSTPADLSPTTAPHLRALKSLRLVRMCFASARIFCVILATAPAAHFIKPCTSSACAPPAQEPLAKSVLLRRQHLNPLPAEQCAGAQPAPGPPASPSHFAAHVSKPRGQTLSHLLPFITFRKRTHTEAALVAQALCHVSCTPVSPHPTT